MENLNFIAIDFETATEDRSSICEIGLCTVENSVIKSIRSWLVKPEGNKYDRFNIMIHGIKPKDTDNAPSFPEIWSIVEPYLSGQIVVAHNTAFDMYALRDALDKYNLCYPHFQHYCSYRASKYVFDDLLNYSLENVCHFLGIKCKTLHRAGYDAEACAKVFMSAIEKSGVSSLDEFQDKYEFKCGEFNWEYFRPQLSCKKRTRNRTEKQTYIGDSTKVDEGSYFYEKTVCFTGKCSYGTRAELLQKIADIGGIPVNSVTKSTDILVVGQQDYRIVGEDGMSFKQEKAVKMKKAGHDIEIMSEKDFLRML